MSESFKSVAQGVPEIFEEVYLGGHNVPPPLVGIGLIPDENLFLSLRPSNFNVILF